MCCNAGKKLIFQGRVVDETRGSGCQDNTGNRELTELVGGSYGFEGNAAWFATVARAARLP